jgi:curli biogenesis system outer membrane secretion channel CsgG/outer membrane protein OmpA-like peptidoglycan-associated protein
MNITAPFGTPTFKHLALASAVLVLAGCTSLPSKQHAPDEEPVVIGSAPRRNYTPNEAAFVCMASGIKQKNKPLVGVAVGDVKDYTGRYSSTEGSTITQGGSLMVYSALGKLGGTVLIQERFDTRIAELELAYTDKRQLGDGRTHTVEAGKPAVPWVPYFGGSIIKSNYYIVGGITELNYNIASSGFEVAVNSTGGKRRTYTMNIGVDLRIVDTRSLLVAKTVSLQKQIIGQEVGVGVYRFFGSDLVDINVGNKNQEPLQMGVRTTIEQGVIELLAAVTEVDAGECLGSPAVASVAATATVKPVVAAPAAKPAADAAPSNSKPNGNGTATAVVAAPLSASDATQSGLAPQNSGNAGASAGQQLVFEFGSSAISGAAMSAVEKIVNDVVQGPPVTFQLVARDTELWPPLQRRELTNQRVKVATDALVAKGIAASRIGVTWMPEATDTSITRLGAGYQLVATMVVGK